MWLFVLFRSFFVGKQKGISVRLVLVKCQSEKRKEAKTNADIAEAWAATILASSSLGEYKSITEKQLFDMEYWSLEQAKLGKIQEQQHHDSTTSLQHQIDNIFEQQRQHQTSTTA